MKRVLISFILLVIATPVIAYEGSPQEQVSLFFKDVKAKKISMGIESLYSGNPTLLEQKKSQLTVLKQHVSTFEILFGEYLDNEIIHTEEFSPSLIRIVHAAKYSNHPLIFEFYFYKPKDKWIVSQFVFADQFETIGRRK